MILDFGCGDGGFDEITQDRLHTQSFLAHFRGDLAFGIDINPQRIERAMACIPHAKFVVADGRHLPFNDGYFKVVHCWGVLHHIADWQIALSEIARVTKPGGYFYLTESVDNYVAFRIARRLWDSWQGDKISGYFTSERLSRSVERYYNIAHEDFYYRTLLSDVLRSRHLEPQISLRFNQFITDILARIGLEKRFCCHYTLLGVRK